MNIIAFDTSSRVLSAALASGDDVWYTEIDAESRHSELLMECADWLCASAALAPAELSLAACMKGPGSFTGLRIGFAAAKGLALALGIPLAAVPTLDCLSYPFGYWPGIVIPALDAKKNCFFAALYRRGERLTSDMDAPAETIARAALGAALNAHEPLLLTGSGAELLGASLAPYIAPEFVNIDKGFNRGKARELLDIVKNIRLSVGDGLNTGPVYLRKSDAELNLK